MRARRGITLAILALMSACSHHEGVFEPACMAHEGDRIELRDGTYKWERFSDEKLVDKDGGVVNPFPDFPRTGNYARSKDRVVFSNELGAELDTRFIVMHAKSAYLLSREERDALTTGGNMPACALRLVEEIE